MPIYEYQCQKCGENIEMMQKFSDPPLKKCPACRGRLAKLMSMNSFQLKGSGWYVTDYAGRKGEPAKAEAAPAGKPAETKAEAKTETKAAAKADTKAPTASQT